MIKYPGSAAHLAAGEEIMQARCLRSQVYFLSRIREYATSVEKALPIAYRM
jgi:hypothetical protein